MKKKGFTLIELLAVLVVLAIVALITIPIVLGIIKRARIKSEEASVRGYADTLEKSYSEWLIDHPNGTFNDFDYINIEYKGNTVTCDDINYNDGNIELECCYVGSDSGRYYRYNNNTVRHYNVCPSKKEYKIGDEITVNGIDFYVIKDSPSSENYVTALKKMPLTISEINNYKYDKNGNIHVNKIYGAYGSHSGENEAVDLNNNVGGMAYYINETCHYSEASNVVPGCTIEYAQSEVKYIVDNWASDQINEKNYNFGRLLNESDLKRLNYDFDYYNNNPIRPSDVPSWLDDVSYSYWTDVQYYSSEQMLWSIGYQEIGGRNCYDFYAAVRPVININKKVID